MAAKKIGELFQDRQSDALQTALYWTEYVLRHKGAIHMRSPATKLHFISYYSLDVIAFLTLLISLMIYIPIKLCKLCCCSKKSASSTPKNNNKRPNTRSSTSTKKDN